MNNYSTFIKLLLENFGRAIASILSQFDGVSITYEYTVEDTVTRKQSTPNT